MTAPISRDDLDNIISFHEDSLASHRWQMSPSAEHLERQTIQALKHYRRLLDVITGTAEYPDPELTPPDLPALDMLAAKEQP